MFAFAPATGLAVWVDNFFDDIDFLVLTTTYNAAPGSVAPVATPLAALSFSAAATAARTGVPASDRSEHSALDLG